MTTATGPASELDPLMRECLREAEAAEREGEVPVGAVVVDEGRIVGRGHNRPIAAHDPARTPRWSRCAAPGAALAKYRLPDCELLVTVEPCVMCVGALLQARVRRVVFGCRTRKPGRWAACSTSAPSRGSTTASKSSAASSPRRPPRCYRLSSVAAVVSTAADLSHPARPGIDKRSAVRRGA